MKVVRGITIAALAAALTVAGLSSAVAQSQCPYDTTGDYTYDPGLIPAYEFYGDGQITYDGTLAWYMDDVLACYNVYKTPGYGPYFPKCDIDGDGQVGINEVYDIYYRVHPVGQGDAIAQNACIEAFAGGSFFFCHPSRYSRTAGDIQAIIAAYPATAAISDANTRGPGHLPEEQLMDELTCTTPGIFPAGLFDALNECYLGVESRSADSAQVYIDFTNALDISNAVGEYSRLAQQFGGVCTPVASGETKGSAPGFHYYKYDDQGWWLWYARTLEQCGGGVCLCDVTYTLWTHQDHPGEVWFQSEAANHNGCTDLRFIDCDISIDNDSDGTPDCIDLCPNDPAKTEPGICGCGVADTDTDGDGTPDCNDLCPSNPYLTQPNIHGDCGDNPNCPELMLAPGVYCPLCYDLPHAPEYDCDWDGVAGWAVVNGTCTTVRGCPEVEVFETYAECESQCFAEDYCPTDPNKTAPGICGCGVSDADSDGDGVADCMDGCPTDPNC